MSSNRLEKELKQNTEFIEHAHKLYKKAMIYSSDLEKDQRRSLGDTVFKILRKNMTNIVQKEVFRYKAFPEIIETTIVNGIFEAEKTANSFAELEKYLILLYKFPWKKEFWTLKLYSGFFNAMVKSHLSKPEEIFLLIGFEFDGDDLLVLKAKPLRDIIFDVCFDCLVAAVECATIGDLHNKIKDRGGDLFDALQWRKTGQMPSDEKLLAKLQNYTDDFYTCYLDKNGDDYNTVPGCSDEKSAPNRDLEPNDYYNPLVVDMQGHRPKTSKDNMLLDEICFIDGVENTASDNVYHEGTLDEHLKASMREVDLKQSKHRDRGNNFEFSVFSRSQEPPRRPTDVMHSKDNKRISRTSYQSEYPPCSIHYPPERFTSTTRRVGLDVSDSASYRNANPALTYEYDVPIYVDGGHYMSNYFDAPVQRTNSYRSETSKSSTKPAPIVEKEWTCSNCTSLNKSVVDICRCCYKSKHQGPDLENPKAGEVKKVCEKCTLENSAHEELCTACGNPLKPGNVQTYV